MRLSDEYMNSPSAHFPNRNFFDEYMNSLDARLPHLIISKPKQEPPPREDKIERVAPKWDDSPSIVRHISETIFGKGATAADIALVKSMLPLHMDARVTYIKGKRLGNAYDTQPITDRIKHRQKIAELHGQTLAVFENDPIDESTKADDLALLTALSNRIDPLQLFTPPPTNAAANTTYKPNRKSLKPQYGISYKQALAILERLDCPKDRKTLQRWLKGENTPQDFTPEKMQSIEAFTSWATIYAHREQSKINTNNALRIDNPNSRRMQKFK